MARGSSSTPWLRLTMRGFIPIAVIILKKIVRVFIIRHLWRP